MRPCAGLCSRGQIKDNCIRSGCYVAILNNTSTHNRIQTTFSEIGAGVGLGLLSFFIDVFM